MQKIITYQKCKCRNYMYFTTFEALIGYLYLRKQDERLKEILNMCL